MAKMATNSARWKQGVGFWWREWETREEEFSIKNRKGPFIYESTSARYFSSLSFLAFIILLNFLGLPSWLLFTAVIRHGKESAYNARGLSSIPGSGRSLGGGRGNPLQYSCLENLHGQRSLAGYSPQVCKESDMTEWLGTHTKHVLNIFKGLLAKTKQNL